MATGRVGGTRSKIAGQVGTEIYQVRKNPDGTYSQIVYAKGERIETETSETLQAQRMVTCIVEAAMRDLKPVGQISMQAYTAKTKSLNAFASFNLKLVADDCKANWYGNNRFYYPVRSMKGAPNEQLGGRFMLSSGTLQADVFDDILHYYDAAGNISGDWNVHDVFAGVKFLIPPEVTTVGQFLKYHRMTRLDNVVFVVFHDWVEESPETGENQQYTRFSHLIAQINPTVRDDEVLTSDVWEKLFVWESDWRSCARLARDGSFGILGTMHDTYDLDEHITFWGAFTISYITGKKEVTSAYLLGDDTGDEPYYADAAPADVFYSWMNQPRLIPWPSPFDQSNGQLKPSRLPDGYQEVEYIQSNGAAGISNPIPFDMGAMSFYCEMIVTGECDVYAAILGSNKGRIRFRFTKNSERNVVSLYMRNNENQEGRIYLNNQITDTKHSFLFKVVDQALEFSIDDEIVLTYDVSSITEFTTSAITLFSFYQSTYIGRIYNVTIKRNSDQQALSRFVPCYRKSDGLAGFYDIVQNLFITAEDAAEKYVIGPLV